MAPSDDESSSRPGQVVLALAAGAALLLLLHHHLTRDADATDAPDATQPRLECDDPTRSEHVAHPVYGPIYLLRGDDLISSHVRHGEVWESRIVDEMRRWYVPGTDVADVGANLGLNALLLHRRLLPGGITGCVHCFEPQADLFVMLGFNVRSIPRRRLYNFAVGDAPAVLTFQPTAGNVGATVMHALRADEDDAAVRVASVPLDTLELTAPLSLMKVDVETMEPLFLRGARRTLERLRPALMIEVFPPQFAEVSGWFAAIGYEQKTGDIENHNYVFAHRDTKPFAA